jgi:hypothetical protein
MSIPQDQLLAAVRQVERKVAGTEEEERILPKLDELRAAIGEMSSHYDARLSEVKKRNQHALEKMEKLSEHLHRFSAMRSADPPKAQAPAREVEGRAASPDFRAAGASEVQEAMGSELAEFPSGLVSPTASAFWSPAEFHGPCESSGSDPWTPPARPPPRARDVSPSGFRTPSPEWSPRDAHVMPGALLRPYGHAHV